MSINRKGPLSQFYAGALKAKLAVAEQEKAQLRKQSEAKSAQNRALRTALIRSVAEARRLRERLAAQGKPARGKGKGDQVMDRTETRDSAYQSVLSPRPDADGRYCGYWCGSLIEVAFTGGAGEIAFVAYVDGRPVPGVYDSRNLAETAARIAIDKMEVCEVDA